MRSCSALRASSRASAGIFTTKLYWRLSPQSLQVMHRSGRYLPFRSGPRVDWIEATQSPEASAMTSDCWG